MVQIWKTTVQPRYCAMTLFQQSLIYNVSCLSNATNIWRHLILSVLQGMSVLFLLWFVSRSRGQRSVNVMFRVIPPILLWPHEAVCLLSILCDHPILNPGGLLLAPQHSSLQTLSCQFTCHSFGSVRIFWIWILHVQFCWCLKLQKLKKSALFKV